MEAVGARAAPTAGGAGRSRRLLALASDELLVRRVRAGSETAFALLYERHHRKLLSFCRHMLGSREEAEDAVQQAFVNAFQDMLRDEKELHFRPWLYRIARNICVSTLRSRRYHSELAETEPSLAGLSEEVAERRELRELLRDLSGLPVEQREALVLAELHGNSHTEVAQIIGCDREKVKSLVFQARTSLMKSREAREVSCEEIRRQLSVLRGGSRRRGIIRRHLRECEGCRRFDSEVRQQRQALALVLPVVPSATLKLGAASAAVAVKGAAAGSVAGGAAVAGGGAVSGGGATGAAISGSLATAASKLGVPLVVVKGAAATAAVTMVAAGGAAGVKVTRDVVADERPAVQSEAREAPRPGAVDRPEAAVGRPGAAAKATHPTRARGRSTRAGTKRRSPRAGGRFGSEERRGPRAHAGRPRGERGRLKSRRELPGRRRGERRVSPERAPLRRRTGSGGGTRPVARPRSARPRLRREPARGPNVRRPRGGEPSAPVEQPQLPLTREGEAPLSGR
jgi:RNA polymerase sigma factor (sigma-70 family)